MSTTRSDAAESERRAGGGRGGLAASAPPDAQNARSTDTREHQDETPGKKQTNHHHDETQRSTVRKQQTHKALTLSTEEVRHRSDSERLNWRSHEPRFTSSLLLRLSSSLGLAPPRLIETLQSRTKESTVEDTRGVFSQETSIKGTHASSLSPANEKKQAIHAVSDEQEVINFEPHDYLCLLQPETCTSFTGKRLKENLRHQSELGRHSDISDHMLSSTVVTVVAPHWGNRMRRPKKADGPGSSGAQWNLQDPNRDLGFQGVKSSFTRDLQDPVRVSSPGPWGSTDNWSTKSEPVSLVSRRTITQTTSLESHAGGINNQRRDARAAIPPFLPHNEQKGASQKSHQAHLLSPSSKPTTSSLLLSLRKFNSDGRSPPPCNSSSSDQNGKCFSPHRSQSILNKNEQERSKSLRSPTSTAYRTTDTQAVFSPPSNNQQQLTQSDTVFFPTSPIVDDAADRPFTQHGQPMNRNQASFTLRGSASKEMTNGQKNGMSHLPTETSFSSPKHLSYNHAPSQKSPSVPRATLTSTSWWKQVTHESNRNVTKNPSEMPNTPFIQTHLNNRDMSYLNSTDNKGNQIHSNRDNNNTVESLYKGNMNLGMQIQRGAPDLKQRDAEYFPGRDSDRILTLRNRSNLKSRDTQKPQSMPGIYFSHKMSRAPLQSAHSPCDDPQTSHIPYSSQQNQAPVTFSKPNSPISPLVTNKLMRLSSSPDFTSTSSSQAFSPVPHTNLSFQFPPGSPQAATQTSYPNTSSQTRKLSEQTNTSPLGFERSYASIPKLVHRKIVSSLVSTLPSSNQTKYNSLPTSPGTTNSPPVSSNPSSAPLESGSLNSIKISSLPTPPTTPVTSSEISTSKGPKTFSHSLERQPKKRPENEVKKARRVTWHDSVEVKSTDLVKKEKMNSSPSPSKSTQSTKSVFASLKPDNSKMGQSPVCSTATSKTSNPQEVKGGKLRSLSSDSADLLSRDNDRKKQRWGDSVSFDQQRQDLTTQRQEIIQSAELDTLQTRSHAALSLPPELSRNYQHRYSSPPYSALMFTRLAHEESKTLPPRSQLFSQSPQSNDTQPLSLKTDATAAKTNLRAPLSPNTSQPSSLPLHNQAATKDNEKSVISETEVNNNFCNIKLMQFNNLMQHNGKVSLGQHSQNKMVHEPTRTCTSERPTYCTKSKVDTSTLFSQSSVSQSLDDLSNTFVSGKKTDPTKQNAIEATDERCGRSVHNFSGSSLKDHQPQASEKRIDCFLGRSKFLSLNSSQEQSPKKSWFSLKKSLSTPNTGTERTSKSGKMDQVFNRLKQKLSIRHSEDDPSYPRKWRRSSETPSVGGTSDISNFSDTSDDSTKTLEERVQEKENDPNGGKKDKEGSDRWTHNRYTIKPFSSAGKMALRNSFSSQSHETALMSERKQTFSEEKTTEHQNQQSLRVQCPILVESDFCKDKSKKSNLLLPCSPCRSPNLSLHRKSTPTPRSPFSPFGSLSPHSPLSLTDATDDVFYSPKLNRRKETSPQPVEGFSLATPRKTRASTGPPSIGPVQNSDCLESLYADLKYGIEPGKTFSVSSVLSSRPSGPGRISTGSRFMSVGDLSQHNKLSKGQWSVTHDGTTEVDGRPSTDQQTFLFPSDPGAMRTRSLPRSLSRCLANWSSDITDTQPSSTSSSTPIHFQGADRSFELGTDEPLTPPPTPPLSPISRRMSKPPSSSPASLSSSSGSPQSAESPSSRGRLPSRGYVSSLSTFEESSDSSSDTTTDDEYYLETDDEREKETEL